MNVFERIYLAGLSLKRTSAIKNRRHLPFPVISIGNLTVGGTGKTPMTIALGREAKRRGFSPVILTRGYRGTAAAPCFVSRGFGPLLDPDKAGDEPVLMAQKLDGIPVVKDGDRFRGGSFAMKALGLSPDSPPDGEGVLFIIDDGFQHWRLFRDRDIVLIDRDNPFGNGRLLPSGRLREPLTALLRAHLIVVTGGTQQEGSDDLAGAIRRQNAHALIFTASHNVTAVRAASGAGESAADLNGKPVFGFCALGNPSSFRNTILSLGANLCGFRAFRDHHSYRPDDLAAIRRAAEDSGAERIVTTEKDFVKLGRLDLPENLFIIEIELIPEAGFYEAALGTGRPF